MATAKKLTKSVKSATVKVKRVINPEKRMVFHCFVCDGDIDVYKKDEMGNFEPQTICVHMAYKGIVG